MTLISPRVRRALLAAGAVIVFPMLAGATYQGVATAIERRQFPHPGQLVDVGGHQLHIHCTGEGSPAVVLEAPATGMSAAWGLVQPALSETTRTCSYDRAGLGWSETGGEAFDPAAVPDQLHALLERSGVQGPYVLVGQGLGAAFATLFAARYAGEVRALVLAGAPTPEAPGTPPQATRQLVHAAPWLARAGILRATRLLSQHAAGLPEPSAGALRAFLNRPDHLTRAAAELSRWEETVALAAQAPVADHVRVVRLGEGGRERLGFLTDSAAANAAIAAIRDAVAAGQR
ncbi:MAG: alpha/beta fold hydrolase [Acidobacteria bacterium]|nr:alpha/beta fold hydrolase [Acidobacteriota bacterium]